MTTATGRTTPPRDHQRVDPLAPRTLGIIELENRPLRLTGCLGDANSFDHRVVYATAQGAWLRRVLDADPSIGAAYADAARTLEEAGAHAIIASCGFAYVYQRQLSGAVEVPVGASPLMLLSLVRRSLSRRAPIAILTFDAGRLLARAREIDISPETCRVVGIEGSDIAQELARDEPVVERCDIEHEVLRICDDAFRWEPELAGVVIECSAFLPAASAIRSRWRVPVFDHRSLASFLLDGLAPVPR